ncbi:MAG: transcription antitermination protein NusB [Thermoleophilaceae bacterium]|jgi:N utilization substance protein B|nr:transcription antitermination protein NusB [Thermoleophilaceae bacterium]
MRRTDQRRAAVVALYQRDVTGRPLGELVDPHAREFTRELVDGVDADSERLDALIERYAEGWTVDRIAPLERNIMRVALFELLERDDIPAEVAIDEAVEAAKELCARETPAFLNGILGAVQREQAAEA